MDLVKQGDKAFKEGKAQIKTGVFKWSKDYNSAVTYFDEATKLYRQAKEWEKSLQALDLCKICNEKLNEIWGTARNIEAMVTILIENVESKEFQRIYELTNEAGMLFKGADSFTESIKLKQKAAKYLYKNQCFDQTIELLESALKDADDSEKMYNKKEVFDYYLEVLIEMNQYSKAITMVKKQFTNPTDTKNRFQTPSYGLCIIILCLLGDEALRADSEFNQLCQVIPGFYSSREYEVSEALIVAYNEGNQEEFINLAQKPCVTNIYPPNIPRILKKKTLKNVQKKPKQNQQTNQVQGDLFGNQVSKQQQGSNQQEQEQQGHQLEDGDDENAIF